MKIITKKEKNYISEHVRLICIITIIVIVGLFLCLNEAKNPDYYSFECIGEYGNTSCQEYNRSMGVLPPAEFRTLPGKVTLYDQSL